MFRLMAAGLPMGFPVKIMIALAIAIAIAIADRCPVIYPFIECVFADGQLTFAARHCQGR